MSSFGDAVTSLVDTYTKCLAFLKDFGRSKQPNESSSELKKALRKARAKVRHAYSSKLSHEGSSFEKGDDGTATSRGSLRRVIRRLTTTLRNLGGSCSTNHAHGLDYASLVSLCDSSRVDAIRTMTDLSSRLSTCSYPKTSSTGSTRPQRSSWAHRRSHNRDRSRARHESRAKRLSGITTSSNSTKLGEIRHQCASHGQGSRVAYPRRLQKHGVPEKKEKKKKKKRWGIF